MLEYWSFVEKFPNLFFNGNVPLKIVTDPRRIASWQEQRRNALIAVGKPPHWADIGIVLDYPYIVVIRDLVEFPDGRLNGYFRIINRADLQGGQGVVILAEMDKKFLLLHQYRHPIRSWSFEAPRGFGEPGVSATDQAKDEIYEEVGGEISELVDLGIYCNNTGLEGNTLELFYAKLKSVGKPAEAEGIESMLWVSLVELEEMIANARITDGFTIAAYTRAKLRGLLNS